MDEKRAKLKRVLEKASKLESNLPIATANEFINLEDKIDGVDTKLTDLNSNIDEKFLSMEESLKKKLESELVLEIDREELKGEQGETYNLTEQDKQDIARKITVPVVEKIIQKTEVVTRETPIVTNQVVQVAVSDPAPILVNKLQSLEGDQRLNYSAISGLEEFITTRMPSQFVNNRIGGGVTQIKAGTGVTITSTGANGRGVVTINASGGGSSQWVDNGDDIYYDLGNVGIGHSAHSPTEGLTINKSNQLSNNIVVNPNFAGGSGAGWVVTGGNGWTFPITGALYTPQIGTISDYPYYIYQNLSIVNGNKYIISFDLVGSTQGGIAMFDATQFAFYIFDAIGDGTYTTSFNANSTFTAQMVFDPTDFDNFDGLGAFDGKIINIIIQEYASTGDLVGVYDGLGDTLFKIKESGNILFNTNSEQPLLDKFTNGYIFKLHNTNSNTRILFDADSPMSGATGGNQFGLQYNSNNQAFFGFLDNGSNIYFVGNQAQLVGTWTFPADGVYPKISRLGNIGGNSTGATSLWVNNTGIGDSQTVSMYTMLYSQNGIAPNLQIGSNGLTIGIRSGATWQNGQPYDTAIFDIAPTTGVVSIATDLTLANLTASRVVLSDSNKKLISSSVTNTEMGYLAGVTSALQTQLNARTFYSGSYSGTGTATTTFTVTIGTTQANTNYKVVTEGLNVLSSAVHYITNKTTTTFDVVYLTGLTGAVAFDWALFP